MQGRFADLVGKTSGTIWSRRENCRQVSLLGNIGSGSLKPWVSHRAKGSMEGRKRLSFQIISSDASNRAFVTLEGRSFESGDLLFSWLIVLSDQ
jgi:hypothetical protein